LIYPLFVCPAKVSAIPSHRCPKFSTFLSMKLYAMQKKLHRSASAV
jgi:hypothetical protein